MLVNFNIEKLDRLLYDFYSLTGLTISVWDADMHQLSYQPKEMCDFCRMIKKSPNGKRSCLASDKKICAESAATGKPTTHHCHAGLLDTAVPIRFNDTVMGFLMFGQAKDSTGELPAGDLMQLCETTKNSPEELLSAYRKLKPFEKEKIDAAANILKAATRYIWLSEYIEIGYNTLASQLSDYIRANISEDISVNSLCRDLGISKNRLYAISHESFGISIGEYISDVRINEAKKLLTTTDMPVSHIGILVGIKDYNYFTKFFKNRVGMPPHRYRREFPFNIHEKQNGKEKAEKRNEKKG